MERGGEANECMRGRGDMIFGKIYRPTLAQVSTDI
jgi:hypothetical protein